LKDSKSRATCSKGPVLHFLISWSAKIVHRIAPFAGTAAPQMHMRSAARVNAAANHLCAKARDAGAHLDTLA